MSAVRTRGGFTLIEVMTALTITALVATLAASALRAGMDVRERVLRHRVTVDAEARATSWIGNMLRHPAPAAAIDEPLFTITHEAGNDAVTFLSQGVETPSGTGTIWRVRLDIHAGALRIHATPAGTQTARVPLESVFPHITKLSVQALEAAVGSAGAGWRSDWPVLRSMPSAVRMTFGTRDTPAPEPLVFAVGLPGLGAP